MRSYGHRKVTTQPTKESKDEVMQETPKQCPRTEENNQACVFVCVCVSCVLGLAIAAVESPFLTAVGIFLETTEAVCCIGSVPFNGHYPQRTATYRNTQSAHSFLASLHWLC